MMKPPSDFQKRMADAMLAEAEAPARHDIAVGMRVKDRRGGGADGIVKAIGYPRRVYTIAGRRIERSDLGVAFVLRDDDTWDYPDLADLETVLATRA